MNHYDLLEMFLPNFFELIPINWNHNSGIIVAHGDKCYQYECEWAEHGIPFSHGVAIYLVSHCAPFSSEVRRTENGWVKPSKWVIDNYQRFKMFLPKLQEEN